MSHSGKTLFAVEMEAVCHPGFTWGVTALMTQLEKKERKKEEVGNREEFICRPGIGESNCE